MAIKMDEKAASYEEQKNFKKKALLTVEDVKYARKLADNEVTLRNKALKLLKEYLKIRSKNSSWVEDNLKILWKGLFYSMWMSDKPLVQEDCAENISKLIHLFNTFQEKMLFFKAGMIVLQNEWPGIDQHRLNKFLMLVRRLLRQAIFVLKEYNFKKRFNQQFSNVLESTVLNVNKVVPVGLFMHFTEIFLEELAKVSDGNLVLKSRFVDLLRPFVAKLAYANDPREIRWISKFVLTYLIKQHDLGMEYNEKYKVWKSLGFPGSIDQIQKVPVVERDEENGLSEEEKKDEPTPNLPNGSKPMDPRAGRVDVELPQIVFPEKEVAEVLLSFTSDKKTSTTARNVLCSFAENFRKLAQGTYPLGMKTLESKKRKNVEEVETNVTKAAKRLIKFENKLLGKNKRRHNGETDEEIPHKKKKIKSIEVNESRKLSLVEKRLLKKMLKQGKPVELGDNDEQSDDDEQSEEEQKSGKQVLTQVQEDEMPDSLPDDAKIDCLFWRNSGVWFVSEEKVMLPKAQSSGQLEKFGIVPTRNSTNGEKCLSPTKAGTQPFKETALIRTKKSKRPEKNKVLDKESSIGPVPGQGKKPKKEREEILTSSQRNGSPKLNLPLQSMLKTINQERRNSLPNLNNPFFGNLRGKSKVSLNNLRCQTSTPQKQFSLNQTSTLSSNSPKKVRINTSLNVSQEIHEHFSQVFSSPQIPFDRHKKPGKPLLKTTAKASPINPFYKLRF